MNKVEILYLRSLRNGEHFQFMTETSTSIAEFTPEALGVSGNYPSFLLMLAKEDVAMKIELGSSKSALVEKYDETREQIWESIDLRVASAEESVFEEEIASGIALRRVIDLYGDPRKLPNNEESGVITNLVDHLLKPENASHLEVVNLIRLVPELKNQNDLFITTVKERNTELASRESGNVKATRVNVDAAYNEIINIVNATLTLKSAQLAASAFVNEHNERISTYQSTVAARQTRSKKAEVKEAEVKEAAKS